MPSLMCPCERLIDLSPIPAPRGLVLFSDRDFGEALRDAAIRLSGGPARSADDIEDVLYDVLGFRSGRHVPGFQCDGCGRILVVNRDDDIVGAFRPEAAAEAALLF